MEQIAIAFENLQRKESVISESMKVLSKKMIYIEQLEKLSNLNENVSKQTTNVLEIKSEFQNTIKDNKKLMHKLQLIQYKMLQLIEHLDEKKKSTSPIRHQPLREISVSTPQLMKRGLAQEAFKEYNTPRMSVDIYAKSPMVKQKTRVNCLQFLDFEADIQRESFEKLPAYMKGRTQLPELQEFLDKVVIKTFNEKYQILYKERSALRPADYQLQLMFRDQNYFEGQKFVTIGDFCRIMQKNVDKKVDRLIQMLRHLQIIREMRHKNTTCYIWLKK